MSTKTYFFLSTAASASILLSIGGCAVTPEECDPRAGGFIRGISCKWHGVYQDRVVQKEAELSGLEQKQGVLITQTNVLESERNAKSQLVAEEREKAEQLENGIFALQGRIDSLKSESEETRKKRKVLSAKLSTLKGKTKRLKASLSQSASQNQSLKFKKLQRENQKLKKELEYLMEEADAAQL
jgi:chromosome segregation ATPase